MARKKKNLVNPVRKYAKVIKEKELRTNDKVFFSILLSTGCRPSEAVAFKYKKHDSLNKLVNLKIPIHKKRKAMSREIVINYGIFGLSSHDFKDNEDNFRSLRTYTRLSTKIIGMSPRDYRHCLAIFVLKKKNIAYVRDMLCHSDIRVTQHYLVDEKVDFEEIAGL